MLLPTSLNSTFPGGWQYVLNGKLFNEFVAHELVVKLYNEYLSSGVKKKYNDILQDVMEYACHRNPSACQESDVEEIKKQNEKKICMGCGGRR